MTGYPVSEQVNTTKNSAPDLVLIFGLVLEMQVQ